MNLRAELAKACIFILIGAFLCNKFLPAPKPPEPLQVKQEQQQACKVVVKKIIKPDGTVSEESSIEASGSQKQEILAEKPKEKKHSALVFKDQISYSYKYIETKNIDLSPMIQLREDKSVHLGIKIDF